MLQEETLAVQSLAASSPFMASSFMSSASCSNCCVRPGSAEHNETKVAKVTILQSPVRCIRCLGWTLEDLDHV
jgi:hypothetical protein